ncbi:glycerate kinase [Dethiosulfatibacter aminovorans DSM 17477]|uniref:Glycerate kinase n=1 Tax=Dethiosulfatibacter aminovorans DSM 17477 TaxID=1121476 RepID=A0A1M6DPV7_9FIRM|nr:glycerate kinase [Dethiosulfatibacter aminovorans]SHI75183.1 glycerate kinase [Dethiosulfatibacter aminovorans DSM 17477]
MKILVGPDSFKDSVSAYKFCEIAKEVIAEHWPEDEVTVLPLADGGEGTVEALVAGQKGEFVYAQVEDPLGTLVNAQYGLIEDGKVAVIEMAAASGLPLVPVELRNPMVASTYGTGQLILDAINKGVKRIIVGIGGSATSDAGLGMLQALGFKCLDKNGNEVERGGIALLQLAAIERPVDRDGKFIFEGIDLLVACDVNNPLYGEKGAAYVYGPQKGATEEMVRELDLGLRNFAEVFKKSLGVEVDSLIGGGAAGGLGACLYGALNGQLKPGFEIIKDQVGLEDILKEGVDLVVTAEGQMNHQSLHGKLPIELAKLAKSYGSKTVAIVGARDIAFEEFYEHGIIGVFPIANCPMTLEYSMMNGENLLRDTLVNVLSLLHN